MPTPCSVSPLMRVCGVHLCKPAGDHARESMYAACMCARLGTAVRVCTCVHDLTHGMCVCMHGWVQTFTTGHVCTLCFMPASDVVLDVAC